MQNNYSKLRQFSKAAKHGATWVSFDYINQKGERKRRNILINVKVGAAMEKRGNPLKGKRNWVSDAAFERNGFALQKGNEFMIRGFERGGTVPKVFKLSSMSNIKC